MRTFIAKTVALIALPLAMNAAFADDLTVADRLPEGYSAPAAQLSRDQVRAETQRAQAAGQIAYGERSTLTPTRDVPSVATRAQVKAELAQALAKGEVRYGDAGRPAAYNGATFSGTAVAE
jgi:Domain of unknown function (DUF4148)